jgi:hypothetical protein
MTEPPDKYNEIATFNKELAAEVRAFLRDLVQDDERLGRYIRDRVTFLREESGLSIAAQDFLCESDFSRVQAVMSQASAPARWLVIWLV